jgi:hypothetical protein
MVAPSHGNLGLEATLKPFYVIVITGGGVAMSKRQVKSKKKQHEDFEKELFEALLNRANRFTKLANLNCPSVILYNEAKILFELAKSLGMGKYHIQQMKDDAEKEGVKAFAFQKNLRNVCATPDCSIYISSQMKRPLGERICPVCVQRAAKKQMEMPLP